MARADELEARIAHLVGQLGREFADLGEDLRFTMTRALIHRAVHYATERGPDGHGVEYCALATYLAEMTVHAHKLAHGDNPRAPTHSDLKH